MSPSTHHAANGVVASWIWHPLAETAATTSGPLEGGNLQDAPLFVSGANNFYLLARASFSARDGDEVVVRCSANDLYVAYVNGVFVGRGPCASDPSYAYLDRFDVTEHVRPGDNVLAFMAFNQGEGSPHPQFQTFRGPGGLLYQVETGAGDVLVASGDGARVLQAPHLQQGTDPLRSTVWGFEEVWNLSLEPEGWREPGFDDSAWDAPTRARYAPEELVPRRLPPLVRWSAHPERLVTVSANDGRIEGKAPGGPFRIDAGVPGSLPTVVVDFGREVVGYPRLELEGHDGYVVVSYGETLELDRCDTVVPNGSATWSPYHRRAFRYLGLEFFHFERCDVVSLSMDCVNAPLEDRGSLALPDPTLEQVWELGRYTLQTATQDYYDSDAWRERAIWYCGTEHRIASVTFGVDGVTGETLRQQARIQDDSGYLPATGPVSNTTVLPDIQAYWMMGLTEGVLASGDLDLASELFANVERLLGWFESEVSESGLLDMTGKPWWVHLDWGRIDRRGEVAIVNFRHVQVLRLAAELARIIGRDAHAATWTARADELRLRCRDRFRDPETGLYADCFADGERSGWRSQQTNAQAILTGVAEPVEGAAIMERVLDPALLPRRPRPFHVITDLWGGWWNTIADNTGYGEPDGAGYGAEIGYAQTGFGAQWVAEALFIAGEAERALDYIRFFWGGMVARGATTGWEVFDPYSRHSAIPRRLTLGTRLRISHNHVYAVGATHLLSRYLLGVAPLEPGYRRFVLAPCSGGLEWAQGRIPTPGGEIEVSWKRRDELLEVAVDVPPGTTAVVSDPDAGKRLLDAGHHTIRLADARS